ncbi:MAG: PEP-CTERM sorting domain-containing protein [Gammaproteobacteria bacterium]|nr:PEP-CTERM sorting domain-containing protein [Gammaproteobacteria bacterium]
MKIKHYLAGACLALGASAAFAVPVELTIEFDNFPNETAFGMWEAGTAPVATAYVADPDLAFIGIAFDVDASSPIGFGDGFSVPGDFAGQPANVPFNFIWDLGAGDYRFIILDAAGDGLCCDFGIGAYSLSVAGTEVGAGSEFDEFELTAFSIDGAPAIPEPNMLALLAIGLLGFGVAGLRK